MIFIHCKYVYVLVLRAGQLSTLVNYTSRLEWNSNYKRSFGARVYKHRVIRTFIDMMDRVLDGVDGLVTQGFDVGH